MHKNKIYTGIGSRETPKDILTLMMNIGATLGSHGWTLRSGHAPGADQAFEHGANYVAGKMEIYLPWEGFEGGDTKFPQFIDGSKFESYEEATQVAAHFHPAWHKCSSGAKKMHIRNVYQVVGLNLDTPSNMVICWTKNGKRGGGTGQALRIAEYLKIPIFDLAVCTQQQILDFVNYGVVP